MTWASIITFGLKLLLSVFTYLKEKQLIDIGEDKAIAEATILLLERTERGKAIRDYVDGLSEKEEDDLWKRMTEQ